MLRTAIPFLIAALMIGAPASASIADKAQADRTIESAVNAKLRDSAAEPVYVIVLLEKTPPAKGANRRKAVKERQDRVLQEFAPAEFAIVHKYENFPSITGYVNNAGLAKLAANPQVKAVGLDVGGHGHLNLSVPFIGADRVQTELALGYTGEGITVAVLDSGIDSDHPDLTDNLADGWYTFLNGDSEPGAEDDHGHGTNVAGIITAAGNIASPGVAPDADILPIKVLDKYNSFLSSSDIAAAVDYVVTHIDDYDNLAVINMSLGTSRKFSECPCDNVSLTWLRNLRNSLDAAKDAGIVIFASTGNEGLTTQMPAPACLSAVTAVAAVYDRNLGREPDGGTYNSNFGGDWPTTFDAQTYPDMITTFSNRNACNELAAPGRHIAAPGRSGETSNYTGTSQASPHCAAVAALMHQKAENLGTSAASPASIIQTMKDTGLPTIDPAMTSPNPIRLSAFAAVNQFIKPWAGFKWKQMPDKSVLSMDIACDIFDYPGTTVQRRLADDFLCTTTGPITKLVLYNSWKADSKVAIHRINLSIYQDIPDPDADGPAFSTPGELLWEKDFYSADSDFTESLYDTVVAAGRLSNASWWDPAAGNVPVSNDHKEIWRYDIHIDQAQAFIQQGDPCQPIVYWLGAHVYFDDPVEIETDPGFGWKTSPTSEAWNDAAVYSNDAGSTWNRLQYPMGTPAAGENIDLAFEIIGQICCSCPDYDSDDAITLQDYARFANDWAWTGQSGGDLTDKDLNCDGTIDYKDISILARLWLAECIDQCRGCF